MHNRHKNTSDLPIWFEVMQTVDEALEEFRIITMADSQEHEETLKNIVKRKMLEKMNEKLRASEFL